MVAFLAVLFFFGLDPFFFDGDFVFGDFIAVGELSTTSTTVAGVADDCDDMLLAEGRGGDVFTSEAAIILPTPPPSFSTVWN